MKLRKRTVFMIAVLSSLAMVAAACGDSDGGALDPDDPLPVYRLAVGTYFLYGNIAQIDDDNRGWNGNAGVVVTQDGVVVIDALGTPKLGQRLIATIRAVTDKPIRYLIITHNHPDHAYGSSAFRALGGVNIVAHAGLLGAAPDRGPDLLQLPGLGRDP